MEKPAIYVASGGPHVGVILVFQRERDGRTEDVVEAYMRLSDTPTCGRDAEKRGRITWRRGVIRHLEFVGPEAIAHMGANWVNGEVTGHDPQAPAPFPVDAPIRDHSSPSLDVLLRFGSELLDQIGRFSQEESLARQAEALSQALGTMQEEGSPDAKGSRVQCPSGSTRVRNDG